MANDRRELYTWEVPFKYFIKLSQVNNTFYSQITCLQSNQTASHSISFSPKTLSTFLLSSIAPRFFHINPETLILTYTKGLQGGGVCCSSKMSIDASPNVQSNSKPSASKDLEIKSPLFTDPEKFAPLNSSEKSTLNTRYEMLHKENAQNSGALDKEFIEAMSIAMRISEQVAHASVSLYDLKLLKKIVKVSKPFAIAWELGKNFATEDFLNSPMCMEQRLKLIRVIRKFIVQDFIENRDRITKTEEMSILFKTLNEASEVLVNQNKLLEFVTILEVNAVKYFVERSQSLVDWWERVAYECKEVLEISINPQQASVPQNMKKICEYFANSWKKLKGGFAEFFLYIALYEKQSGQLYEKSELLEDVMRTQLIYFSGNSYEERGVFLSYAEKWIRSGKIRESFVSEFIQSFTNMCNDSNWKLRIHTCYLLRVLRGFKNLNIKQKAFEMTEMRLMVENDEKVLAVLKLPTVYPVSKKADVKVNMADLLDFSKIVSREDEVAQVNSFFRQKPETGTQKNIIALCGAAGIGKTAVALKYARENARNYSFIIQINCESENIILASFAEYSHTQKILEKDDKNAFAKLKNHLLGMTNSGLIIFDNASSYDSISDYLVDNKHIDFLATSKNTSWQNKIMINDLSLDSSITALQIRLNTFEESKDHKSICEKIGGSPLFIKRLAGDILKLKVTSHKYQSENPQKLEKSKTLDLVSKSLISNLPSESLDLLKIVAHCSPRHIPARMIKTIFLKSHSRSQWLKGKSTLINYYIITWGRQTWTIDQATWEMLKVYTSENYRNMLIDYMYEFFIVSPHQIDLFANVLQLLPHAEKILDRPTTNSKEAELQAYVARAYALVVRDTKIALVHAEKAAGSLGPVSKTNERAYFKVGEVFREIGKYDRSDDLLHKSLSILEETSDTKLVADAYVALGLLYKLQILYEKSKEWFLKALEIQERTLSPMHPDLAFTYNYLGMIFKDLGKYDQSEDYLIKALRIQEYIYQPNDPALAYVYNYLGSMYRSRGKLEQSEFYLLKCLKIQENILDAYHPALAVTYNVLGKLYTDLKKWDKGEEFYLKCLNVRESSLESRHAHLVVTYQNIAIFYQKMGDMQKCDFYKSKAC